MQKPNLTTVALISITIVSVLVSVMSFVVRDASAQEDKVTTRETQVTDLNAKINNIDLVIMQKVDLVADLTAQLSGATKDLKTAQSDRDALVRQKLAITNETNSQTPTFQ